jgi:recombination protein RecA
VKCACGNFRESVCAFVDIEGSWDEGWAVRQGVDPKRLLLSQPEFGEQAIDIADAILRSGECDLLAMDSVATLTPMTEIENSMSKDQMGAQPRMIGKGMRKIGMALNELANKAGRRPTVLLINQIRFKIGVMFGNPETQPGGQSPGFAATTETRISPGEYKMDKPEKGSEDEKAGMMKPLYADMNFRVTKNKSYVARIEGSFRLNFVDSPVKKMGDVIDEPFMVQQAEAIGLMDKKEGSWHLLGQSFDTKSQVEERLMTDPQYKRVVRNALMQVLLAV